MDENNKAPKMHGNFWKQPWVILVIIAVGYWVYTYHWEHALGILPYLILLLCPLMHIFMHHGNGHNEHHSKKKSEDDRKEGK